MSNNSKKNPFIPAGGGAWKKLDRPAQPPRRLSATDSDKKLVLRQLTEFFGSVIDQNVIETVASSCGWNVQLSIDALIEVSSNVNTFSTRKVETSNIVSQTREMKPRQSPSTVPSLQAIKVAYEGYDDSSDDADVIIEDEEEVQIVQNVLPRLGLPSSNLPRTQPLGKPVPKETKHGPFKGAQSLEIDVVTESINRGIKIMVLMRGVPGSGKSFLAKKLITDSLLDAKPEQFIFSTDEFFCQSGQYVFAPQKLPEAHEWNRRRVVAALQRGTSPLIVDNTNTEVWEMKPYVFPAVHYGYAIEILEPTTPWCRKESELCRRNTHGVPRQNIRNMLERYEKTNVADMMSRFECSYAYGNIPPQPCSNKPKMKSARKAQREIGKRRKSTSEPRENSRSPRVAVGKNTKNGELQVNNRPQPQRVAKQVSSNVVNVTARDLLLATCYTALEKDIETKASQKEVTKPLESGSDCSAGNLIDIEPVNVTNVNAGCDLEEPATLAVGHDDVRTKMKLELKGSLRLQGPRGEMGDVVHEIFKEDVLVRLGQRDAQRAGLSAEERLVVMDREVDQLVDEMWEHFIQLNGTGSDGDDSAEVEMKSGKDGAVAIDQQDYGILAATVNATDIKTESEKLGVCALARDDQDCKILSAKEGEVVEIKTESRNDSLLAESRDDNKTLASNKDLAVSKEVAADLIENLINSVDSVLTLAEERGNSSAPKNVTKVPKPNDVIEKSVNVPISKSVSISSIKEDDSLSAEYSLVAPLLSGLDSPPIGNVKTETENNVGGEKQSDRQPSECPPPTTAEGSTNQNASITTSSIFTDVSVTKVMAKEPEKPAPKQSGLFSWLFPRKPAAAPVNSVPAKVDIVFGFSDPSYTVFDQGVNCNPGKQLHSVDRNVSPVERDSELFTTESIPSRSQLLRALENCSELSNQEAIQHAEDEELSLLIDAADLSNEAETCVVIPAIDCQTPSVEGILETREIASDALAGFEEEERAIDILLSKLSTDKLNKINPCLEILPPTLMQGTEETFDELSLVNQFEIVPSDSLLGTNEKSEDLNQVNQSFETLPPNSAENKSYPLEEINAIPDLSGFTNPWAEVESKAIVDVSPPLPLDLKPREPKATRNSATNTTHADFSAAEGSAAFSSESTVVSARGRSINDDSPATSGVDEERTRPAFFSLDKGCMTSPVESEPRQHDFDLLVNMFPRIGADDLREVFDKCRHEINWTVELLLESGYDFEPRDEVDTGFDVAQGLETTQHLLEELNTRDQSMIPDSIKQEPLPQQEPSSFPSEPSTSSPATKKSLKKPSQLTLALQRQVESGVHIGESFYSEHTRKLRRLRHGESEPLEAEPAGPDSDSETMENEDEAVVPLTVDTEFLRQLQRLFGQLPFQYPEGVPPVVQLPVALARQIHGYLIESQQQQLDKQEEYFQNMIKDEEFARRLQQEEMPAPDLREIMDMELALELYRASQREPNPAQDDLATRLSRQKLLQQFPNVNRDVLAEVFAAHAYSFSETVAVIEASVKADGEQVKNVLSPEALLALEKQLIKQAQEESKKQSESSSAAEGGEWSAVGARVTPAMDSARNFREEALRLVQLRGECFRKASDAHRKGQTAVASYYAQVGHLYKEHIEEANSRAAAALLAANAEDRQSTTLDLHFLYVAEALEALDIFLDHHVASLATAGINDSRPLFIITGAGQHSAGGRPRIKPAVERRLAQRKAKFFQVNPGMLKVTATKNMPLSSSL